MHNKTLYTTKTIGWKNALSLSANIGILAVFYTFLGAFVSYIFYYIFDEYDPDSDPPKNKKWEDAPIWFKVLDVSVQISITGLISFWVSYYINSSAPIIPVRSDLTSYIDTYTTGMFFMYSVFLFSTDWINKIKFLYNTTIGGHFDKWFPDTGSILTFDLGYSSRKTNDTKTES
jgi:hypothetical protein